MIIFNYDQLDQFLSALIHRVGNEVFAYYIEERNPNGELTGENIIYLQFLGHPDPSLTALYQCRIKINKKEEREQLMATLLQAFQKAGGIQMIQGKIQEMFMSVA